MPAFSVWNSVNGAKPGAAIVANLAVGGGDSLAAGLVTQQFGAGLAALACRRPVAAGHALRPDDKNDDLAQGWRQMARLAYRRRPASRGGRGRSTQIVSPTVQTRDYGSR
ncbi:MAG: hypothetical protein U0892_05180 [Pirellulales bacterium]